MARVGAPSQPLAPIRPTAFWTILLLAVFYISNRQCDARAVNVSNTWTMPQEGLNVFYRFFRDRISWFEADAVCQFHHANLVTVDNSFQFDATRDLLRELDVNDIVWIGLMRPQNSEHFMWSNSRPLIADTGYWAESLPLMESPLCAVIDPIRDYRWHALRCGGPETASFLCEMPVPSWADACILREMPNLTMQYMADTASIELIRNCEEEGQLRQTCKGRQDRERVIRELICPRERLEAQRINDITNSHFKSLQIINSIPTDNNENNDIELLPLEQHYPGDSSLATDHYGAVETQTEKNTVQRLIEQFNVDELMQADEPASQLSGYNIPGEIPKPVKKAGTKKVHFATGDYPKKVNKSKQVENPMFREPFATQKSFEQHRFSLDDMMMGDQPLGEPEVIESERNAGDDHSNEIMAPLPHMKKTLLQDLKAMTTKATPVEPAKIAKETPHNSEESRSEESKEDILATLITAITTTSTTTTTEAATTTTTTTVAPVTTTAAPSTPPPPPPTTPQAPPATDSRLEDELPITTADNPAPAPSSAPTTSTSTSTTTTTTTTTAAVPVASIATTENAETAATLPPATIGHPMHPQQPRSNVISEETAHPHIKESADNSHFIPPMLMVKSHYVPPSRQHATDAAVHPADHHQRDIAVDNEHNMAAATTTTTTTTTTTAPTTTTTDAPPTTATTEEPIAAPTTKIAAAGVAGGPTTGDSSENASLKDARTEDAIIATTTAPEAVTFEAIDVMNKELLKEQQQHVNTDVVASIKRGSTVGQPIAPHVNATTDKSTTTTTTVAVPATSTTTTTTVKAIELPHKTIELKDSAKELIATTTTTTTTSTQNPTATPIETISVTTPTTTTKTTTGKPEIRKTETQSSESDDDEQDKANGDGKSIANNLTTEQPTPAAAATTTRITATANLPVTTTTNKAAAAAGGEAPGSGDVAYEVAAEMHSITATTTESTTTTTIDDIASALPTRNFLKDEPEMPFKPNRRRSLTQPETASYFKNIFLG